MKMKLEMDTLTKLARAVELLERSHAQAHLAYDQFGMPVEPNSPAAASWCAIGAMYKEGMDEVEINLVGYHVARKHGGFDLGSTNRHRDFIARINDRQRQYDGRERIRALLRDVIHANLPRKSLWQRLRDRLTA